jgi:hypothetical protein
LPFAQLDERVVGVLAMDAGALLGCQACGDALADRFDPDRGGSAVLLEFVKGGLLTGPDIDGEGLPSLCVCVDLDCLVS